MKTKVYTPQRELRLRIKLLSRRLNKAYLVKDELAKSRLTIELIDRITDLEKRLEKLEAPPAPAPDPPAETTEDKLKSWAKSRT